MYYFEAHEDTHDSGEKQAKPGDDPHKYRGSQQSSRKVKPKFIDSTQG
jgi:hypothetical protein